MFWKIPTWADRRQIHDEAGTPTSEEPIMSGNHSRSNTTAKRTDNKKRLKFLMSYAPDWVLTLLLAAIFLALNQVHGFRREFSVDDESIRFPYAVHERVPDVALYCIAVAAPLVIQLAVNLITVRSFWDYHCSALGLVLGLAITGSITQFSKITVGRPRPDLLSRCIPMSGSEDPTYGLSTDAICTQTNQSIMIDGWRSFPSGHSSLSFAGLGFLSFYLAGKLHLFDTKGHAPKAWISVTPLAGATLVAISRTMDYRHHWEDVVTGSVLGFAVAYLHIGNISLHSLLPCRIDPIPLVFPVMRQSSLQRRMMCSVPVTMAKANMWSLLVTPVLAR